MTNFKLHTLVNGFVVSTVRNATFEAAETLVFEGNDDGSVKEYSLELYAKRHDFEDSDRVLRNLHFALVTEMSDTGSTLYSEVFCRAVERTRLNGAEGV